MWCRIRGSGLSYDYRLMNNLSVGRIVLSLYRATSPSKAFAAALDIVGETFKDDFVWNPLELEAAKSSLIFEEVEHLKSLPAAVVDAMDGAMKGLEQDHLK